MTPPSSGSSLSEQLPLIQRKTACNRDCPDACGIVATVQGDRIVRLQGDPDHPVTQGFLCERTARFLDRQYSPDRITTPLRRKGNEFLPISWDEALGEIAETMLRVRAESGPAAIMYYSCGGSMGILKGVCDYFFERFGPVTGKSGDVCTGAGDVAQMTDFGAEDSHDLFDLHHSRTIVLWGKNVHVGNVHLLPILMEARSRGAQIVSVDPVHHRTAAFADLYVQPRPGGDRALALGVARLFFERQQVDPQASEYCDHLAEFERLARSHSADEWADLAGVSYKALDSLAQAYACGPAALLIGWGLQRRRHGSATVRVIDALGAISGNIGIPGGGVSYYYKRRGAFDLGFAKRDEVAPRLIPEPLFGPAVLAANDPPIRVLWVTAANPVAMLPESETVARALETRELTVVVDSFLTDSARHAHLVLPTTTLLEEDDLLGAYGHHWVVESRPVIDPPPGVKSDYQIIQELARRTGLEGEFTDSLETWKRRVLGPVADKGASLEDLRRGAVRNPLAPQLMYSDRKFPTASGKVNLIHEVDVNPTRATPTRPLILMALSTSKSQAAQWDRKDQQGPAIATVHPLAAPNFEEGEIARLESEQGELRVQLHFDSKQRPEVVLMDKGGWLSAGRCANALVKAEVTDAGGCAVYYDTPVRLLKFPTCC
jgi:anaerobic selenocysteine-containing dehydrogenase